MSRTKKGRKRPGYEYSSKRGSAAGVDYGTPGPFTKKLTSRWERRQGKMNLHIVGEVVKLPTGTKLPEYGIVRKVYEEQGELYVTVEIKGGQLIRLLASKVELTEPIR